MVVTEVFNAKPMAASGALFGASGGILGGFLCTTAGTLALDAGADATGADIVVTTAVSAGVFLPMPFAFSGAVFATLAGGATGTFAVLPNPA